MKGSCLCKRVQYQCDQLDGGIVNCHCQTCRKAQASVYAPTAAVKREHFRWVTGSEFVSAYPSSPDKNRHFCSVCGTHLIAERPHQGHIILRVATLDDDPGQTPQSHIWCSHDVSWLSEEDNVPHYTEWPPGR